MESKRAPGKTFFRLLFLIMSAVRADFSIASFKLADSSVGSTAASQLYLSLSGNADINIYSLDYNTTCSLTDNLAYDNFAASYNITQTLPTSIRPTYYYVADPSKDYEAATQDASGKYRSIVEVSDKYFPPGKHYATSSVAYPTTQHCSFALRLANSIPNQLGYATFTQQQRLLYGFSTELEFQLLHPAQNCVKDLWCNPRPGDGFAILFHNLGSSLSGGGTGPGLGYTGLQNLVVVELDLVGSSSSGDPAKPHVAVLYKDDGALTAGHESVLAATLLESDLSDSKVHKIRVEYVRSSLEGMKGPMGAFQTRSTTNKFFDRTYVNNWLQRFEIGLLSVYIDDMVHPLLQTFSNIGKMASLVEYSTNYQEAGKGYVSISSTTSTDNYAAVQFLSWKFAATDKCLGLSTLNCTQWQKVNTASQRQVHLRNVGSETLYMRMRTKSGEWRSCVDSDVVISPSYYHPYWDGCEVSVLYDSSIEDLEVFSKNRDAYQNFSSAFGTFWNKYFVKDGIRICARVDAGVVELGLCTCELCASFFDFQVAFAYSRKADCKSLYSAYCPCYETSKMSFTQTMEFQQHPICTECKYDSHCRLYNPTAFCLSDTPSYLIGNPFTTTPASFGFKDYIRDKGRVTDGKIKGNSCDCETTRTPYTDTSGGREQYLAYPLYQMTGALQDCLDCLAHPYKFETDCYVVCGTGVALSALTPTSGDLCVTCILSSEPFQQLKAADQALLLSCFTAAKKAGQSVFTACRTNILPSEDFSALYVGMITHFVAECPGRPMTSPGTATNPGGVCMPYYNFNLYSPNTTVIKMLRTGGNWPVNYQCLNSACKMVSKATCTGASDNCVCHDTCPTGSPDYPFKLAGVQVPCSGRGICRYSGTCMCVHGYLPPNCQDHCLDLEGGCCGSNADCPTGKTCGSQNVEGIGTCA